MMPVDIIHPEVQERTPYNQGKKESGWALVPGTELWKRKLQSGLKAIFRDLEESMLTGALAMVGAGRRQRPAKRIGAILLQYVAQDAHLPVHAGAGS